MIYAVIDLTRFTDLPVSKYCCMVFRGEFYKKIHLLDWTVLLMLGIQRNFLLKYIAGNSGQKLNVRFSEGPVVGSSTVINNVS